MWMTELATNTSTAERTMGSQSALRGVIGSSAVVLVCRESYLRRASRFRSAAVLRFPRMSTDSESRIGLFVFNQADEYHRRLAMEAEEAARQHGVGVDVFDAGDTAAKQAQDLVRFAAESPGTRRCAMVVPFADAVAEGTAIQDGATYRLARRVLQKGVGWILLNHGREELITALRLEFSSLPVAMVAVDNHEFGRIQARQLRARVKPGARVLCVRGN